MELHTIIYENKNVVVLLDDDMKLVKPVYGYLKYLGQKDRAFNTIKANCNDLKLYWEFLNREHYQYDEVIPNVIGEFIEHLREPNDTDNVVTLYAESKRTGKTINRILSTVYNFYKYCGMVKEINNPIIMEDVNRPFDMFKSILHHVITKLSNLYLRLKKVKLLLN